MFGEMAFVGLRKRPGLTEFDEGTPRRGGVSSSW